MASLPGIFGLNAVVRPCGSVALQDCVGELGGRGFKSEASAGMGLRCFGKSCGLKMEAYSLLGIVSDVVHLRG